MRNKGKKERERDMSKQTIEKIRSQEKFKELDGLLIVKPENILYVLGFGIESESIIFLPNEEKIDSNGKAWLFLNALEYDQAKKLIESDQKLANLIEIKQIPPGKRNFVQRKINKLKLKKLGFEDGYISVKRYRNWKEKFKVEEFCPASEFISQARLIKTQEEIERIKKAAKIGEVGFQAIVDIIEAGMTEKALAAEAEYAMRKAGAEGRSFETIVASGTQSAFPHAKTSMKKIEDGDLIIVDLGAIFEGYCSDMTRTFIFGTQGKEQKELVNLVNEGQQHTLEQVKTGMACKALDKIARDYYIEHKKEWGNRFIHSLGHGVGIDVHEGPYLSPISEDILKENMIVTIEPGLYITGMGGARTEDLVVVKKDGFESLTTCPKHSY